MEPMMKVINALSALTAALQELTEQTTKGYLSTFEEICNPETDEQPKSEQKAVTIEEVRAVLSELSRAGKTAQVKALLRKHGADKLGEIDPGEYAVLLKEAGELNA